MSYSPFNGSDKNESFDRRQNAIKMIPQNYRQRTINSFLPVVFAKIMVGAVARVPKPKCTTACCHEGLQQVAK